MIQFLISVGLAGTFTLPIIVLGYLVEKDLDRDRSVNVDYCSNERKRH